MSAPSRANANATARPIPESPPVTIGDRLCQDVREYLMATGKRGDNLPFSTSTGSPVSRNVFRTRVWVPAIERSGIRQRVRFHDLRGAHASWLLAGGADLKAVMDRLGHKQIQTTQQYLGRLPDADDRAAFESVRHRRHLISPAQARRLRSARACSMSNTAGCQSTGSQARAWCGSSTWSGSNLSL